MTLSKHYSCEGSINPFSYICDVCGLSIASNTVCGEECILIYIKDGVEIERIEGEYDGFGGVFTDKKGETYSLERERSFWKTPREEIDDAYESWEDSTGICAFHKKCYHSDVVLVKSQPDPLDGYGLYDRIGKK